MTLLDLDLPFCLPVFLVHFTLLCSISMKLNCDVGKLKHIPSLSGIRLYNTRKLVPSGLLLVLSLGALGVFYSAYMQDKV